MKATNEATITNEQVEDIPIRNGGGSAYTLYRWRWVILALFSLISMSNEVIWISLSSITSIVKDYYEVDSIAVNWLSIIFSLFYIFVIASTYILDKYGLKVTIVVGAVLNAIGSILRAIGSNRDGFVLVFLGNSFAGLAQCFLLFIPPRLAFVWFGDKERSTASSIGVLMNIFGIALGFLLGGSIVPSSKNMENEVKDGMHRLLISQAVFCSLLALLSLFLIREKPPSPPSRSQELALKRKDQIVDEADDSDSTGTYNTLSGNTESIQFQDRNTACFNEASSAQQNTLDNSENRGYIDLAVAELSHVPAFRESLHILAKDKSFHLLAQAFGIHGSQLILSSTLLNEIVISKYPGKEKAIGYMGFAAGVTGLFGIFFSGILLDKTRMYKRLSVIVFAACGFLILVFTILLEYSDNFVALFIIYCIFGFFLFSYTVIGLEYVAEITYPVPEGTTSGILFFLANIYGISLTSIAAIAMREYGGRIGGYVMLGFFILCLLLVSLNSANLKRSEIDRGQ